MARLLRGTGRPADCPLHFVTSQRTRSGLNSKRNSGDGKGHSRHGGPRWLFPSRGSFTTRNAIHRNSNPQIRQPRTRSETARCGNGYERDRVRSQRTGPGQGFGSLPAELDDGEVGMPPEALNLAVVFVLAAWLPLAAILRRRKRRALAVERAMSYRLSIDRQHPAQRTV